MRSTETRSDRSFEPTVAVVLLVVSFLAWSSWVLLRPEAHPYEDLSKGVYTDHFSDMNVTRVFPKVGTDIWRHPLSELGDPVDERLRARMPEDVQAAPLHDMVIVDGLSLEKPFVSSWTQRPSLQPPGSEAITAPAAIVYHFTDLSFRGVNKLLIIMFLLLGHVSLFVLFRQGWLDGARSPVGLLVGAVVYGEVVHWALEGFYEAATIGPLILSAYYLKRKNGLAGIAFFAVAVNIHLRAVFFAPLPVYGLFLILRDKQWRTWKRWNWIVATVTALSSLAVLTIAYWWWPHLREMPVNNVVGLSADDVRVEVVTLLLLGLALLGGAFAWARAWLDVAVVVWLGIMALSMREVFAWDVLTLLAWLGMPLIGGMQADRIIRDARFLAVLFVAVIVFGNNLMPLWLQHVFAW